MNNSIKLHLACSKKPTHDNRKILNFIKVTKENCVATDAKIMAVVPTESIFDSDFILDIPKEGFLIHSEDYKKMTQFDRATWKIKCEVIKMEHKKKRSVLIEVVKETDDPFYTIGKFPDWKSAFPSLNNIEKELKPKIGIDADNLYRLQQSMGLKTSILTFFKGYKPAEVDSISGRTNNVYGLIGQCPISE